MKRARILLADDHALILEGIRSILDTDYELVGMVSDGRSLLEAAVRLRPDVIILDISLPRLNGIDAAHYIKKVLPSSKMIVLTMHDNPTYLHNALAAGASGYVLKTSAVNDLPTAVQAVTNGCIYVTPGFGQGISEQFQSRPRDLIRSQSVLTKREREVLQLVAEGLTAKEIAYTLNIAIQTVGFHKYQIMNKVGLRTTAELTRYAIQEGLVVGGSPIE
jgi:DNA-binding NarL/FixJ family response regulator